MCPECWTIQKANSANEETTCDNCGVDFNPSTGYVSGEHYTCPECGQRRGIIDATKQFGKPDATIYAVEYYCRSCDEKGYRSPTHHDHELYQRASAELKKEWDSLPIPTQERYRGTSDFAHNHGYHYYYQMFNDRQLLLLGRLINGIDDIENQNIKEFFLLAFSATLEANNEFCMYNRSYNKIEPMFNYNHLSPYAD